MAATSIKNIENRLKRKKQRVFMPCDVRRIMIYCLNDNPSVSNDEMIALLAKTLGYTHVSLKKRDEIVDEVEEKKTSQLIDWLETTRDYLDKILLGFGVR
jgi:ribosomal protein L32E